MMFHETSLAGVFEIHVEPKQDERGFFARTWCQQEFDAQGFTSKLVQCSISINTRLGTLRGLHYQAAPHGETKVVRCTKGAIYDVILDLRPGSRTYRRWTSLLLTSEKCNSVYIPEGCAHGFLTLEDETEVFYQMSEFFNAESARGIRWNDPAFRIAWPGRVEIISDRDRTCPDFEAKHQHSERV
jgi:dTDP-4-dehydrorhamnose 3,5-epimerase